MFQVTHSGLDPRAGWSCLEGHCTRHFPEGEGNPTWTITLYNTYIHVHRHNGHYSVIQASKSVKWWLSVAPKRTCGGCSGFSHLPSWTVPERRASLGRISSVVGPAGREPAHWSDLWPWPCHWEWGGSTRPGCAPEPEEPGLEVWAGHQSIPITPITTNTSSIGNTS